MACPCISTGGVTATFTLLVVGAVLQEASVSSFLRTNCIKVALRRAVDLCVRSTGDVASLFSLNDPTRGLFMTPVGVVAGETDDPTGLLMAWFSGRDP